MDWTTHERWVSDDMIAKTVSITGLGGGSPFPQRVVTECTEGLFGDI